MFYIHLHSRFEINSFENQWPFKTSYSFILLLLAVHQISHINKFHCGKISGENQTFKSFKIFLFSFFILCPWFNIVIEVVKCTFTSSNYPFGIPSTTQNFLPFVIKLKGLRTCGISSQTYKLCLYPMNGLLLCFKISQKFQPNEYFYSVRIPWTLGIGNLDYHDHFRAFILTKYTKDCIYDYHFHFIVAAAGFSSNIFLFSGGEY